jgi:hypothetical protein
VLAQLAITADPFAGTDESSSNEPSSSQRALQLAEATGDPDSRHLALQARQSDLVDGQHVLERLAVGERAVRLGQETGLNEYTAWGRSWRLDAFAELVGGFSSTPSWRRRWRRRAAQGPLWMWRLTMVQASLALVEGRFDQASALADRALEIGVRTGHHAAAFFHLVFSTYHGLQTGNGLDDVERAVRQFVTSGPYPARGWHAEVLVGLGRLDEAAALWDAITPHLATFPRHAPEWIIAGAGHATLCVAFGDRATAALVYDALLPYADRQIVAGAHTPSNGPAALYLGRLAALLEKWDAAEGHLRAALAAGKSMGSLPFEAMTHLELARLPAGSVG